jgi:hypothetical protein
VSEPTLDRGLDPQVRRKANRLGLLLGGACLALTVAFMIIFTVYGFPKDPVEYRRLMNRRQALIDQGGADGQPAPAPPAPQRPVDQRALDPRPADPRPADQH